MRYTILIVLLALIDTGCGGARERPPMSGKIAACALQTGAEIGYAVAFSPDCALVAVAAGKDVQVLETATGRHVRALADGPGIGHAMAWSSDGAQVALGGANGTIAVWDAGSGKRLQELKCEGKVLALAIVDGRVVAVSHSRITLVHTWTLGAGDEATTLKVRPHARLNTMPEESIEPRVVAISPDGARLASACGTNDDVHVRVLSLPDGKEVDRLGITERVGALAFGPRGLVAAGDVIGRVRVWDANGRLVTLLSERTEEVAQVGFEGERLWAAAGQAVDVWDVASWKRTGTATVDRGQVYAASITPDGRFAAATTNLGAFILTVGPAAQKNAARRAADEPADTRPGVQRIGAHDRPLVASALSPDGATLATIAEDHVVKLWDAQSGAWKTQLEGIRGAPTSVDWSADGKWLATASAGNRSEPASVPDPENSVRLWDAATGKCVASLETQIGPAPQARFLADGSLLAAQNDGVLRAYSVPSLERRDGLELTLGGRLSALATSRDRLGIGLATENTGRLLLTDLAGKELHARNTEKPVNAIAFSDDGKWTVYAAEKIVVLDAAYKQVAELDHHYWPYWASFSPDSRLLATTGGDGVLTLHACGTWEPTKKLEPAPYQRRSGGLGPISFSLDGKRVIQGDLIWTP